MSDNEVAVDKSCDQIRMDDVKKHDMVPQLRGYATRGLQRMYLPEEKKFVFNVERVGEKTVPQGISRRYTAITMIGLAKEDDETVKTILGGDTLHGLCESMANDIDTVTNLGDVALTLWALCAAGYPERSAVRDRLLELKPHALLYPTVELAWTVDAFRLAGVDVENETFKQTACRLMNAFGDESALFPHMIGAGQKWLRAHVSCFADLVYPTHALSYYYKLVNSQEALDKATRCAQQFCKVMGAEGQWWWHYDYRTGRVLEPYPVYSVHQDSMAPMALFAVQDAGGPDFSREIQKGLDWLAHAREIDGSLIDANEDLIWRRVGRREPGKATRCMQALMSKVHPSLRAPGVDLFFPPTFIDHENRPYHLGWILYAWPGERASAWTGGKGE